MRAGASEHKGLSSLIWWESDVSWRGRFECWNQCFVSVSHGAGAHDTLIHLQRVFREGHTFTACLTLPRFIPALSAAQRGIPHQSVRGVQQGKTRTVGGCYGIPLLHGDHSCSWISHRAHGSTLFNIFSPHFRTHLSQRSTDQQDLVILRCFLLLWIFFNGTNILMWPKIKTSESVYRT